MFNQFLNQNRKYIPLVKTQTRSVNNSNLLYDVTLANTVNFECYEVAKILSNDLECLSSVISWIPTLHVVGRGAARSAAQLRGSKAKGNIFEGTVEQNCQNEDKQ